MPMQSLNLIGLIFDLFGATVVLAPEWPPAYATLLKIENIARKFEDIPYIRRVTHPFVELKRIQSAQDTLLNENRIHNSNRWSSKTQHLLEYFSEPRALSDGDPVFSEFKQLLINEFDIAPTFNTISIGHVPQADQNSRMPAQKCLNLSIFTKIGERYERSYVDDISLSEVKQLVERRKSRIMLNIGGGSLFIGFSLQILSNII
jgi:hypothetical protein